MTILATAINLDHAIGFILGLIASVTVAIPKLAVAIRALRQALADAKVELNGRIDRVKNTADEGIAKNTDRIIDVAKAIAPVPPPAPTPEAIIEAVETQGSNPP